MNKSGAIFLVMCLLLCTPVVGAEDKGSATPWKSAFAAARSNAASKAHGKYVSKVTRQLKATLLEARDACAPASAGAQDFKFVMLTRVGRSGVVEEVLVRPETGVALCLRLMAVMEEYPKPPSPPFWFEVEFGK